MTAGAFDTWSDEADDFVHWLYRHGLMTTTQLAALCGRRREAVQRRLKRLREEHGVLERIQVGANTPYRWFLTPAGREACEGMPEAGPAMSVQRARNALARHLLGVNELGVVLAAAARERGDRFDAYHWRHEQHLNLGPRDSLRADAVIDYELAVDQGIRPITAFVELDRGTEPIDALIAKIAAYNQYRSWRPAATKARPKPDVDWAHRFTTFPAIYFVFDCAGADRRMASFAARAVNDSRLHDAFPTLTIRMAALDRLATDGPFAPEAFIKIPNLERCPFGN